MKLVANDISSVTILLSSIRVILSEQIYLSENMGLIDFQNILLSFTTEHFRLLKYSLLAFLNKFVQLLC